MRAAAGVLGFFGLLYFSVAATAVEPGESWLVVVSRDIPFSSRHVTCEREPNGNWRFVQTTRSLYTLLGQRQENVEEFSCTTDPTFTPISCRATTRALSGAASVSGTVEDNHLILSFERGELKYERRMPFSGRMTFDVCLPTILSLAEGEPLELNVIEPGTWEIGKVTITRDGEENGLLGWRLKSDAPLSCLGTWWLDREGRFERAALTSGKVSLRRATPEVALQLKHMEFSDRDLLMFTIDRDLPFPERLESLTMKLIWSGTPLDELQLEDTRQHILSHHQEGDRHELVLRLEQPAEVKDAAPLPVDVEGMDAYLAETRFIKPRDATIVEQAQKWQADAKTTLDAVRNLTRGVYDYMQGGALIAETLSGPEVLACRSGKCSEFTTLLASLTRSAGVPTRVALGMRLVNGRWVGHMWCETWVGEWIPVDATANEVGGSPALLKITHSDTVMGTQRAQFALAETLELSIVDVAQPQTNSAWQTGIVGQTYSNADFKVRISAPDEKWTIVDQSQPGVVTLRFKPSEKFASGEPLVHFVAFGLPGPLDPAVLIGAHKGQFASRAKNFEVVVDEPLDVAGDQARRFVFLQQDPKDENKRIKTTEYLWVADKSGFLLNLIAEESLHDAVLPQLEAILKTFERERPAGP